MRRLGSSVHKLETAFVILLLSLFAITTFVLVLLGVKQYRSTADAMDHNYEIRTATSYLKEKVRQSDINSSLTIGELYDIPSLTITSTINNQRYCTYIYYYDGYLRELFIEENAVYSVESGQQIIPLQNLSFESISSDVIKATITDSNGHDNPVFLLTKSTF